MYQLEFILFILISKSWQNLNDNLNYRRSWRRCDESRVYLIDIGPRGETEVRGEEVGGS